jgi:carboxyl-terminal processing protease
MSTRKRLCSSIVLSLTLAQLVFPQDKRPGQLPPGTDSDPFSISVGSTFYASGGAPGSAVKNRLKKETISADFEEALDVIRRNHASTRGPDPAGLTGSAVSSMLKALDPHSNYYDPSEFQEMLDEHASEFTGTGSSIAAFEKGGAVDTFVVSTLPDSPAAMAGLRFGDKIMSIDGRTAAGLSLDSIRHLLRGKKGTAVRLLVEPAGSGPSRVIDVRRDRLHEPAVPPGFTLPGGVGYIDLTRGFSNATFAEFEAALSEVKRQGARSLVLDLRGNGGGILDQAIRVAEKFLPASTLIVSQRGRYPAENRDWRSANAKYESMPLVLLVDENSASATEVLAGALQDNDRALIVGRRTFGKGLVQSVLHLPEGAGLTLTAARYFTPAGRSIQRDYADTGLYDYYTHKSGRVEIDKSMYAARTITKRVVYGGDGIAPDELSDAGTFTKDRIRLLDPLFFFARGHAQDTPAGNSPISGRLRELRRRILFQEPIVDEADFVEFEIFLTSDAKWRKLRPTLAREKAFIREMMAYYLAMAAFGADAAGRARIGSDPAVALAIDALPRSAELAAMAKKARSATPTNKKAR